MCSYIELLITYSLYAYLHLLVWVIPKAHLGIETGHKKFICEEVEKENGKEKRLVKECFANGLGHLRIIPFVVRDVDILSPDLFAGGFSYKP